jgi:uncharacterized sulfatase
MAEQGVRFERTYCPNPTCTPTRASLVTGKYPSQHGAWALGTKLPEDEPTIGDEMQQADYRTALVGKAHFQPLHGTAEFPSIEGYPTLQDLDFWREFDGPFYGFEHVELARNHADEAHVGQHYALWLEENGCDNWRDYFRPPTGNNPDLYRNWNIPEEYHYDAWIAERTNALMEQYRDAGENFFLWASFFDPHPKYLVPEPWDTMYDPQELTVPKMVRDEFGDMPPHYALTQQEDPDYSAWSQSGHYMHGFRSHVHDDDELAQNIAIYYAMTSLIDKYIGEILNNLERLGLADNTIVVFTTDHGHFFGQHGLIAKGPFHYEDMIRLPFICRWPGHIPEGKVSEALQSLVDLPPTLMSLAGVEVPRYMTGVDQSEVWLGAKDRVRDGLVVENHHEPTTIHMKTYVGDRYKLTVYYNRDYGELFDLQEDPDELNNLWDDPDARELKADLVMKLLFQEMGKEPLWMPRIWGA